MNNKDIEKIIALLPKFQTDREWLEQYRRDSNITLAVLAILTCGIYVAIFVMAAIHRYTP